MSVSALWIVASAVLGAIFGSFMNVVIFRLPRGLSISQPRWSFCPHCNKQISFRDNLPIIGWLLLRGRCRNCSKPIGVVYPIVEAITALVFLSLADALFVGKVLPLIGEPSTDWPIALAYFSLFFTLLAISAMDIEAYSVDVRVLVIAMIVGVVATGAWFAIADPLSRTALTHIVSPRSPALLGTAGAAYQSVPPTGLLPPSMAMVGAVMGIVWWVGDMLLSRIRGRKNETVPASAETENEDLLPDSPSYLLTSTQKFRPFPLLVLVAIIVGLAVWVVAFPDTGLGKSVSPAVLRGMLALAMLMLMLLLASIVHRESDQQIIDEIEAERITARRVAILETRSLLPAFMAGLGLFLFFRLTNRLDFTWSDLLGMVSGNSTARNFIAGLCLSLGALVWSAAIGWFVRIAGTLGFGKEAFGTGDIYIMAAIGAVMGVWGLIFTFFLAALLAIMGVIATSFWKSSRAVPFGPWLGLGAFAAIWVSKDLLGYFAPFGDMLWSILTGVVK